MLMKIKHGIVVHVHHEYVHEGCSVREDDARNDLRKMGVKNWKQRAEERKQWKEIIEPAKTHKEL
jgi:CRISPR/Cas system-associated endonuclease Cas1